jgi:hypothetical protein
MFSVYTRVALYVCGKHACLLYFKVKCSSRSIKALNTGACAKKHFRAIIIPGPHPSRISWCKAWSLPGNTNLRGKLSTVDLLTKIACFVKKKIMLAISKVDELK